MVTTIYGDARLVHEMVKTKDDFLTPDLMTMSGGDSSSAADKKRNKLGYHRTAIACGHCRRRKIRCIPPVDPTSNRCQNCVRLKKECQYYPVDQSTQQSTKRSSETKGDGLTTGSETSVSSSSPRLSMGNPDPFDMYRANLESSSLNQSAGSYPPLTASANMMTSSDNYGYSPQFAASQWPQQAPFSHQSRHVGEDRQPNNVQGEGYWPPSEHIPQAPYDPATYTVSTNEAVSATTVPDHRYPVYPAVTQEYSYAPQQIRGDRPVNANSMTSYGLYRQGTLSDSAHHQTTMGLQSQQLSTSSYPTPATQPQYSSPSGIAPKWSDAMQMQPTFSQQGSQYNWYSPSTVDNHGKPRGSHVLASQNNGRNQYQTNAG